MRDQIIEEIKRLAAENNGKAPGMELFASRTGIRKHEWLGKYWTHWGDALIDAGFLPNEFTKKLDKFAAFEPIANFIKELQRVPTTAEFEMRRHKDPNFPNIRSILVQFEGKAHMIAELRTWAQSNEGFADVVALLPINTAQSKMSAQRATPKEGHVPLNWSTVLQKQSIRSFSEGGHSWMQFYILTGRTTACLREMRLNNSPLFIA